MAPDVHSEALRWIATWEHLADALRDGYDLCIYEYANDVSSRHLLHDHWDHPAVKPMHDRIELADAKLRAILTPTLTCIHGDYPDTYFWYWSYPPGSAELESDLRERGAI